MRKNSTKAPNCFLSGCGSDFEVITKHPLELNPVEELTEDDEDDDEDDEDSDY